MRRFRVFLDTNVLYSARLRDVFLTFAEIGVIDVYWSSDVLVELERALQREDRLTAAQTTKLVETLQRVFPLSAIAWSAETAQGLSLPDRDDVHVLAAAIDGECDVLVTDNLADFPEDAVPVAPDLLAILNADEAIQYLGSIFTDSVPAVIEAMHRRLRRPEMSVAEMLEHLGELAPLGAVVLGAAIGRVDDRPLWSS